MLSVVSWTPFSSIRRRIRGHSSSRGGGEARLRGITGKVGSGGGPRNAASDGGRGIPPGYNGEKNGCVERSGKSGLPNGRCCGRGSASARVRASVIERSGFEVGGRGGGGRSGTKAERGGESEGEGDEWGGVTDDVGEFTGRRGFLSGEGVPANQSECFWEFECKHWWMWVISGSPSTGKPPVVAYHVKYWIAVQNTSFTLMWWQITKTWAVVRCIESSNYHVNYDFLTNF